MIDADLAELYGVENATGAIRSKMMSSPRPVENQPKPLKTSAK
jgi:hypothetical protein